MIGKICGKTIYSYSFHSLRLQPFCYVSCLSQAEEIFQSENDKEFAARVYLNPQIGNLRILTSSSALKMKVAIDVTDLESTPV